MSEKALLLAKEDILNAIWKKKPELSYDEVSELADTILSKVDWDNPALMHKGMEWIALFYLERLGLA